MQNNKWHVYEFMKQWFMRTGAVPDYDDLRSEFAEMDPDEFVEGVVEFFRMIGQSQEGETTWADTNAITC